MRMQLDLPLFPGYVFVKIAPRDCLRVLESPSVASIVKAGKQLAILPDQEIEVLRAGLAHLAAEPHPWLAIGSRVRVKSGALTGLEGFLVQKKGNHRFVLSLDLIMQAVSVEIDALDIEPVSSRPQPNKSLLVQ